MEDSVKKYYHCECNRNAIHHRANHCPQIAIVNALQSDGVRRNLCGDCTSTGDTQEKEPESTEE